MGLKSFGQISCPNCGAKLDIKTGLRAKTFVCDYCGTILEPTGEIVALQNLHELKEKYRPKSFIHLGMTGHFLGHEYQVVGRIRVEGSTPAGTWDWDEWFLMSPTGYPLWIQEDDEGFQIQHVFVPTSFVNPYLGDFPTTYSQAKEMLRGEVRQTLHPGPGKPPYDAEEYGIARIVYIEGELTWRARPGDEVIYFDYRRGKSRFAIEISKNEMQVLEGSHITAKKLKAAFGLLKEEPGKKPAKPKKKSELPSRAMRLGLIILLIVVFVGMLLMYFVAGTKGEKIYSARARMIVTRDTMLSKNQQDVYVPALSGGPETFEVGDPSKVYRLHVESSRLPRVSEWDFGVTLWEVRPDGKWRRLTTFWTSFWTDYDPEDGYEYATSDDFYFTGLQKGKKYFLTYSAEASLSNARKINSIRTVYVSLYKDAWYPPVFLYGAGATMLLMLLMVWWMERIGE